MQRETKIDEICDILEDMRDMDEESYDELLNEYLERASFLNEKEGKIGEIETDVDSIAEFMVDYNESLDNDDIQEILDKEQDYEMKYYVK